MMRAARAQREAKQPGNLITFPDYFGSFEMTEANFFKTASWCAWMWKELAM
jgi:hypothetical protein